MTLVTPSLVFYNVSIVYTSILILLTSLLLTQQVVTSTMLLDTKVPHLMTLDYSIVLTCRYKWYVPSERTPSSPRLASRLVMELLPTHSQKDSLKVSVPLTLTQTATTGALLLRTSCDIDGYIPFTFQRTLRGPFFCP